METSAIIMLVFGLTLLYGGLAALITIAAKSKNK